MKFHPFSAAVILSLIGACTNQTTGGVYDGCETLFRSDSIRRTACMFGVEKARDCLVRYRSDGQLGREAAEGCGNADCQRYSDRTEGTQPNSQLRNVLNSAQNENDCKKGVEFCLANPTQCDRR